MLKLASNKHNQTQANMNRKDLQLSYKKTVSMPGKKQALRPLLAGLSLALTLSAGSNMTAFPESLLQTDKLASSSYSSAADLIKTLADEYFDFKFKSNPDLATILGIHEYDRLSPSFSEAEVKLEIEKLKSFQKSFARISTNTLSIDEKIDLSLLRSDITSRLLELEQVMSWRKNPDFYSSSCSSMIYDLISKDFAPLAQRLESVIEREKKIPEILKSARTNLKNPPHIFTETAIEQMPGIIDLFEKNIPQKFESLAKENEALFERFSELNRETVSALRSYLQFMENELLARSKGSFALGEKIYAQKLACEEMEVRSIDELLALGEAEMQRLKKEFISCAAEIEAKKTALEVFKEVSEEHTSPDKLLASIRGLLDELKDFCLKRKIVSIPEAGDLRVEETPAFMRALTFAALDAPGPFESKAKEAYYYVTLPEPGWTAQKTEEHMRAFCKYDLINTSVHEAYPGHYLQGLWGKKANSKTRKILGANSNIEGWAHYCEQMAFEEGLFDFDKKLRLVVLHDALLRCARYLAGIRMHCRQMSLEEAIDYFEKEAFQERANAQREAKRGTMDPTYLVYTLGKLQILKLRYEYKELKGNKFTLQDFHDRVLSTGTPPISLVRQILLDKDNEQKQ